MSCPLKKRFSTNIYLATLYQLLVAMFLFSACRLFFYIYNIDQFNDIPFSSLARIFLGGLRFDLTAILYLNILFIVMRVLPFRFVYKKGYIKTTNIVFAVCNGLGIAANVGDTGYFRFTNTRTRAMFFKELGQDNNAIGIFINQTLHYWPLLAGGILLILLLIYLSERVEIKPITFTNKKLQTILQWCLIPVLAGIILIGIRGGIQDGYPIAIADAITYTHNNRDVNLVLNTPFTMMRSIGKREVVEIMDYMPQDSVASIYSPIHVPTKNETAFRQKNIVLIILEGIGASFIEKFNNLSLDPSYKSLTPFLDSLCSESYICKNTYSTGRRSSEGINAILGGFPAFKSFFYMSSPYNHNTIDGLPALLAKKGYQSAFYCGCNKGSYAFETFSKSIGYHKFIGREEYNNEEDFDGTWGIFDDKMAAYILNDLQHTTQPFLASWFTISSHGPYALPEAYKGKYKSPDRTMDQMVEYVDEVLSDFFKEAQKTDWYDNTLFVITADHGSIMENPLYNSPNTLYKVPLIFFTPDGSIAPQIDTLTASQLDIFPSILGYLGYNEPFIAVGQNIFSDPISGRFAVNNVNNQYQIVQGPYLLQFNGEQSVAMFDKETDPLLQKNIISDMPEKAHQMEKLLKAFLQEYTHRIVENRLSWQTEKKQP
ncbi:MAG: LTA synthase family protein [Bacteroidales bacterium]|nr:LTA synthase family protein [Bacteroidales bacterium]